jgi:hypothetical protein
VLAGTTSVHCAEGWAHACAPWSDLGTKAEFGLDDIFVPCPDYLDHLGVRLAP